MSSHTNVLAEEILAQLPQAAELYHRLLLVVGPPQSGKTAILTLLAGAREWPLENVNLHLSEALLELTRKQRSLRTPRLLADLCSGTEREVILLDNIEMLFAPELAQDPLRLLQNLARNHTLVVAWCGGFDGSHLTYAAPAHPEHRRYGRPEALIVTTRKTA